MNTLKKFDLSSQELTSLVDIGNCNEKPSIRVRLCLAYSKSSLHFYDVCFFALQVDSAFEVAL